jgi:hypothetical protein
MKLCGVQEKIYFFHKILLRLQRNDAMTCKKTFFLFLSCFLMISAVSHGAGDFSASSWGTVPELTMAADYRNVAGDPSVRHNFIEKSEAYVNLFLNIEELEIAYGSYP